MHKIKTEVKIFKMAIRIKYITYLTQSEFSQSLWEQMKK